MVPARGASTTDAGGAEGLPEEGVGGSDRSQRPLARRVDGIYHRIDTSGSWRLVMAVAKVFRTGRSQAIRLPKEFRVMADTVHLKRTEEGFLVITKDPWEIFFEGVALLS